MKITHSFLFLLIFGCGLASLSQALAQAPEIEMINLEGKSENEVSKAISSDLVSNTYITNGAEILIVNPSGQTINKITTEDVESNIRINEFTYRKSNIMLWFHQNRNQYVVEITPDGQLVSEITHICKLGDIATSRGQLCTFSPDDQIMIIATERDREMQTNVASKFLGNYPSPPREIPESIIVYDRSLNVTKKISTHDIDDTFQCSITAVSNSGVVLVGGDVGPTTKYKMGYWVSNGDSWKKIDFSVFGKDTPENLYTLIDAGFSSDNEIYWLGFVKPKGSKTEELHRFTYDIKNDLLNWSAEKLELDAPWRGEKFYKVVTSEIIGGRIFFGIHCSKQFIIGSVQNGVFEWAKHGTDENESTDALMLHPVNLHDRFLLIYAPANSLSLDASPGKTDIFLFNQHGDGEGKRIVIEHPHKWLRMEGSYDLLFTLINRSLFEIKEEERKSHVLIRVK